MPAGRAGIRTYANDLNPKCYEYMKINARAAKVKGRVKCYNMCARAFIRALLKYGPGPPPEEDARKPADDGKKEEKEKKRSRDGRRPGTTTTTATRPPGRCSTTSR